MVAKPDIARMADGEQIGRVVVPLVVIDVMDNKGASVSGFCHSASLAAMAVSITDSGSQTASETGAVLASQSAHPCGVTRARQIAATIGSRHICSPRRGTLYQTALDRCRRGVAATISLQTRRRAKFDFLGAKGVTKPSRCEPLRTLVPSLVILLEPRSCARSIVPMCIPSRFKLLGYGRDQRSAVTTTWNLRHRRYLGEPLRHTAPGFLTRCQRHVRNRSRLLRPDAIALWRNSARVAPSVDRALPPASPGKGV